MKKNILICFFITTVFTSNIFSSIAQTETWDYPVKPGTPEWQHFKTGQEMWNACQIPENVFKENIHFGTSRNLFEFPFDGRLGFVK